MTGYVVFGVLFVVGLAGYWWFSRLLRDPYVAYENYRDDLGK